MRKDKRKAGAYMGKKKIEHIVFDGVRKQKPSIPFQKVNQTPLGAAKKTGKNSVKNKQK